MSVWEGNVKHIPETERFQELTCIPSTVTRSTVDQDSAVFFDVEAFQILLRYHADRNVFCIRVMPMRPF